MNKLTINNLDLRGKRVFIRVDFNVPLKDGVVTDETRIRETLPTVRLAIQKGARLVLASHLGRPKGGPDLKSSLRPAAKKQEDRRRHAHWRRHGLHVPQSRRPAHRQVARRRRQARSRQAPPRRSSAEKIRPASSRRSRRWR